MAIALTIVLSNNAGVLDRSELRFTNTTPTQGALQQRIHAVIAGWTLAPGDTIEILGNEEAFDKL